MAAWTTTLLNLRYHWKAALIWSIGVIGMLLMVLTARASRADAATLEIPGPGTTLSGIGVISGWKCSAGELTIRFDGGLLVPLVYGSERKDVLREGACDYDRVGFVSIMNWGELGDGPHTAVAYDDGREFARSTFTVVTTGEAFLRGETGQGEAVLSNGQRARLVWAEAAQGFEAVAFTDPPNKDICTTKTGTISQVTREGAAEFVTVTVTNSCDGVELDVTLTPITEQFEFRCRDFVLVQPPDVEKELWETYQYYGHGYAGHPAWEAGYDGRGYVTLHQPGNTTGICHERSFGQTRTFQVSVDPERVDNVLPFNFLEPFQIYYGYGEEFQKVAAEHLLFEFP